MLHPYKLIQIFYHVKFCVASVTPMELNVLIAVAKKVENIAPIAYHWEMEDVVK